MKTITMTINYGGFIGTDEEIEFEVEDNATEAEIMAEANSVFEQYIWDNCSFEIND